MVKYDGKKEERTTTGVVPTRIIGRIPLAVFVVTDTLPPDFLITQYPFNVVP
ncbi:MAG: hypothetical protein ABIL46_09520 [candidate division WOR-3 bacterium]